MTKRICRAALLALACLPGWAQTSTFYIEFGVGAEAVERWDGSIAVSSGTPARLESRHFSAEDALVGDDSWRATTRRERIEGFARVNYNEMSPAELPPTLYSPVGVYATVDGAAARVTVRTAQGEFGFRADQTGFEPRPFLDGRALVARLEPTTKLSTEEFEDDEAAATRLPNGDLVVAWIAYKDRGDRVLTRTLSNGEWGPTEEATEAPGDLFRVSLAADADGGLWAFWSERDGTRWDIRGRRRLDGRWGSVQRISESGSNSFHRAAASADGDVFVVWQSRRGPNGKSDIQVRRFSGGEWSPETRLSESPANDWEPQIAGGPGGRAYVAWDGYDSGNYDIFFRAFENDAWGEIRRVTSSPRFQAHASVAVDPQGRPWLAWDESGANWGKDQGYLITPPPSVPLHQERSVRVVVWDGGRWLEPRAKLEPFYVYRLFPNFENPQIAFDGDGALTVIFRHWTRQQAHGIGSRQMWENFAARFDGERWTRPVPLPNGAGSIEKRAALVRDDAGDLHAAWMTDQRPFEDMVPRNAEIFYAKLGRAGAPARIDAERLTPFVEPFVEELPVHPFEADNVRAMREYEVEAGERRYKIYRGEMHRHSDISQDFKYDGSLIEIYRYALDAADYDYIVPTDHQLGYDQEFTWWRDEKLTDLFHVPDSFVPLFGYERSLPFPNGHRNVVFPARGTRPLPIPAAETRGEIRTGPALFPYLRENNGISMPHSSGTAQGTDWADYDPEVEPLMEIFQGYRASYEYLGAPLAADHQKLREQRSGFNPIGYYWNALAKGYKIGVQASSDHWSTHISHAMILSEEFTREALFEAMKKRHAYAATDNIILDFQAEIDGERYIMGDVIDADRAPTLFLKAVGTDRIKQLVIVKNQKIIYARAPNAESVTLRFRDTDFEPGANYYYMRVLQNNGMVAWSSPIWVE